MAGFFDFLMGRGQGGLQFPPMVTGINPDAPVPPQPTFGLPTTGMAGQGTQYGSIGERFNDAFNSPLFHVGIGLLGQGQFGPGIQQGLLSYNQNRTANERRGLLGLQQQQLQATMAEQQRKRQQAAQYRASLDPNDPMAQLPDEQLLQAAAAQAARGPERPIVAGNRVLDPKDPSKVLADLRETPEERKLRLEQEAEIKGRVDRPQYGLTPIWGQDANGNPVLLQPSNRGGVLPVQFPSGIKPAEPFDKIDTGTSILYVDKVNRNVIKEVPKNVAGKAAQEAAGGKVGDAVATAPNALAAADQITRNLDALEKHPGLSLGTGLTSWTSAIPGTPQADFESRRQQLQGQAFLQMYQQLKGGGAITEAEGAKASAALARLQTAVSEKDFRTALQEFRREVGVLRGIAEKRADVGRSLNVPGMPPQNNTRLKFNPATGEIE